MKEPMKIAWAVAFVMSCSALTPCLLADEVTIPAATYILPFDTAFNQDVGAERNLGWNGAFTTQGTHFQLVVSPWGKAMQGWGEGPYVYDSNNVRFNYGWSWTCNLRLKTVNKPMGIIMSLGRCAHGVNPGLVITTDGANGIALKVVKGQSTIMDSCSVPVANATTEYHDYTLVFTYNKTTQHGEIKAYADGVYKASVVNTIAPYYTGSQGIQLFGQFGGRSASVCTYGSSSAPESCIEDFRFWRDTVFTAEQVALLHQRNSGRLPPYDQPKYHWTFDTVLNTPQMGQTTLNFSNGMNYTLVASPAGQALQGKNEGPYWGGNFDLTGDWTWVMRAKTINSAKNCLCSLGYCCYNNGGGLLVTTDGANGIKALIVKSKNTALTTLTVPVTNPTAEFHDYAFVRDSANKKVLVYVDGVYKGELAWDSAELKTTGTVQLFGQCGGIGNYCSYDNPGSQIEDVKFYRRSLAAADLAALASAKTFVWKGEPGKSALNSNEANRVWTLQGGDGTLVPFLHGGSMVFDDTAAATSVTMYENMCADSVTVDNSSKNYTFAGAYGLNGTGPFIKKGTGTVTWGPIGLVNRAVIDIQAGVLKMNTAVANMFGSSGEVTVRNGAQFDLHNTGGAGVASPVVNKTFRVAGVGPDGTGAIVDTGNNNSGPHLGDVILEADATIGGTSRIDFRTANKGITGAGKTLTIKNTSEVCVNGGKIAVGEIDIVAGARLTYTAGSVTADTISLPAGAYLRFLSTGSFAGAVGGAGTVEFMNGANFALDASKLAPTLSVMSGSSTVTVAAPVKATPMFADIVIAADSALRIELNAATGFEIGDSFAITSAAVDNDSFSRLDVALTGTQELDLQVSRDGSDRVVVTIVAPAPKDLVWAATGASGTWDRGVTANWSNLLDSGAASVFVNGNPVLFNDSGAPAVTVAANVSPSKIVFDNSTQDYSVSGDFIVSANEGLYKKGAGTLTWGGTQVAATTPIVISNGVMKLNTATADIFGSSGEITIADGGQFDLNNQQANAATSPIVNKTFKIEGAGPDGQGAFVNNGIASWGYQLGNVVMTGDATIGGTGRTDLRTSGKGITGAGKTLTVKAFMLGVLNGAKIDVGTVKVADGGDLRFEANFSFNAGEIVLTNGTCSTYASSGTSSLPLPAVPIRVQGEGTIYDSNGYYRLKETVTVEEGATLHLTCYSNASRGLDSEKPFYNYGTVSHESGFWGYYGLINYPGATIIHDSEDAGGVKSYSSITNNGVIWVKKTAAGGSQKINYAECKTYGAGDYRITGGELRLAGNNLLDFTGRVIYGGGTLTLSAVTGGTTVLSGAPWQFVVDTGATYALPLTVAADANLANLGTIVGVKPEVRGTLALNVAMGAERKSGKWKLTNTGDYTPADIANWQLAFSGAEGQQGFFNVINGNVFLCFGRKGCVVYIR